jgi:hypothetical protein
MNPLAKQVNDTIERENPHVYNLLSKLGKKIYFIREGILSQSLEAKTRAKKYNATLGTALRTVSPCT